MEKGISKKQNRTVIWFCFFFRFWIQNQKRENGSFFTVSLFLVWNEKRKKGGFSLFCFLFQTKKQTIKTYTDPETTLFSFFVSNQKQKNRKKKRAVFPFLVLNPKKRKTKKTKSNNGPILVFWNSFFHFSVWRSTLKQGQVGHVTRK